MRAAAVSMPSNRVAGSPIDAGFGPGASLFFKGIDEEQLSCAYSCLGVQLFAFDRGDEILACSAGRSYYGVLDSGIAFDVRRHANGDRTLVDVIEPGDLFGEGWRAGRWNGGEPPRERAAVGATVGTVLLLDPARLADPSIACPAKAAVQANLLRSVVQKEERLRAKLEILRHRSLRAKLANYLLVESQRRGSARFSLPLSRAELAEYLHADRAAVSRELARMQDDGLIEFHRSSFVLRSLDEAMLEAG